MTGVDANLTNDNAKQDLPDVLLQSITVKNILSFGPDTPQLTLQPLNVLIGPNGSGKSNFIESIALLRSTANDIVGTISRGGGTAQWIWKGKPDAVAMLNATVAFPEGYSPLVHHIAFRTENQSFRLMVESISDAIAKLEAELPFLHYQSDLLLDALHAAVSGRPLPHRYDAGTSILRQLRDPVNRPEITHLAQQYESIRIYREWHFGRNSIFRVPQQADMRTDRLEEDFSNLGLFLNQLRRTPDAKNAILTHLYDLYTGIDDFDVSVVGGTVQVFLTEGRFTIPATRLSDGTLRYLCLLAILCDPTPPPLICIEEPELGLHPDILPKLADLLIDASSRTQLIVTTHSDILVDALSEQPEAVIVCEKHDSQTQMKRLSRDDLSVWLEKYRLGELWTRGQLGGTRW